MNNNENTKTNFSLLMNKLNLTGSELAEALHIDSSLISKWKRNRRKFRNNSEIFNSLVRYIMFIDEAEDYKNIRSLLSNEFPAARKMDAGTLEVLLKKWLIEAVSPADSEIEFEKYITDNTDCSSTTTYEFKGKTGKKNAILSVLRYGTALKGNNELWCYMQDEEKWFTGDHSYIEKWTTVNLNFLDGGNTIYLIQDVNLQGERLAISMLAWLPLYLTGKVKGYFIEDTDGIPQNNSLVVLKNKVSLYQFANDNTNDTEGAVFVTESPSANIAIYKILQQCFNKAIPCFTSYYRNDGTQYMTFLSRMVELDESQYLLMRFPFVNMIPLDEMKEILDENEVPASQQPSIIQTCQMLKNDLRKDSSHHFRYLIPKDEFVTLLQQKKIALDTISFFCGKPIFITNIRFRQLVKRLSEVLQHNSHTNIREVALLNEVTAKQMRGLNILVKKDTCISIFNNPSIIEEGGPQVLSSMELPIISAMYNVCQRLWETAFPQNRDKFMVSRQLQIWLQTIPITKE